MEKSLKKYILGMAPILKYKKIDKPI